MLLTWDIPMQWASSFCTVCPTPSEPICVPHISRFHASRCCLALPSLAAQRRLLRDTAGRPASHGARAMQGCVLPSCNWHVTSGMEFVRLLLMFNTHRQAPKCPAYSNILDISFSRDLWAFWEETKVALHHRGLRLHAAFQKWDSLLPCTSSNHPYAHKAKGTCWTLPLVAPWRIWLGSMCSRYV